MKGLFTAKLRISTSANRTLRQLSGFWVAEMQPAGKSRTREMNVRPAWVAGQDLPKGNGSAKWAGAESNDGGNF
jgi:hypothetical protein